MPKKAKPCPAWLMTFADLMSLLMAVFVLLFAMSVLEEQKYIQTIESLNETLVGEGGLSDEQKAYINLVKEAQTSDDDTPEIEEDQPETVIDGLKPLYESLMKTFKGAKNGKDVKIDYDSAKQEIKLTFPEQISFAPGSAELKPAFSEMLNDTLRLQFKAVTVQVVGHTDKRPIAGGRFYSNWELSSARAASVIVELVETGRIRPDQGLAVGVADTQPISEGNSAFDFAKNRRVEVIITPEDDE